MTQLEYLERRLANVEFALNKLLNYEQGIILNHPTELDRINFIADLINHLSSQDREIEKIKEAFQYD